MVSVTVDVFAAIFAQSVDGVVYGRSDSACGCLRGRDTEFFERLDEAPRDVAESILSLTYHAILYLYKL